MSLQKDIANLNAAVDVFAANMKTKLKSKAMEGYHDWDNPACSDEILQRFIKNVIQEDWLDVANLAMFLHRFQIKG